MQPMLILLPATAYSLLTLIFARRLSVGDISEAFIKAHLVIFAFIAVSTEFLSSIQAISFPGLLIAWVLFLLVCFAFATLLIYRRSKGLNVPVLQLLTPLTAILVGVIVFILTATIATAVLYPPNNWDSMTYHMSRVVHWISNNNISFYPTAIMRQNYQMPLAEFAIMHMQMITGFDLYANLVQWVSFLVLICLGLITAAELGLSSRQQLISAIVIGTLPMAILQASSTQNDLVVSSFVMSFGLFMLRIHKKLSAENLLLAAIALGLALLTKGTAYLYCAAIGTSLAVSILLEYRADRARFLKATVALSFVVIVALVMNAGHLSRNYKLYGHPLSIEDKYYRNADMSAATLLSNIARNGALHLATPSSRINNYIYRAMQVALGSQLNNPKTTFPGTSFGIPYIKHEDIAGNLIPLLAKTITVEIRGIGKCISHVIVFCMVFYSLNFVCANTSRSLVSLDWCHKDRMELYFINRKDLFQDYENAIHVVQEAGPQEVGLYLGGNDWEYPFWAFAMRTKKNGRAMTFKHVGVSNISKTIDEDAFLPLYVIVTKKIDNWRYAAKYVSVYTSNHVSVFKKSEHNNAISAPSKKG